MNSWASEFKFAGCRVLVTGASGFIGWHLTRALVDCGAEVHGLCRRTSHPDLPRECRIWTVNLNDLDTLRETFARVRPQVVFHIAGLVTARQDAALILPTLEDNLLASVHVLLQAQQSGCERVVVAGSSEELFPSDPEDAPTSPYAAAKAATAAYARMFHRLYGLPVVLVRPFLTYGPRQEPTKLIPYTIVSLLEEEPPKIASGNRVCDFIYVADVVRGLLAAGGAPEAVGKTIELGTGKGLLIREVVERLAQLIGSRAQPIFQTIPDRCSERAQVADTQAAKQLLGWQPRWTLEDGLAETLAWYRARLARYAVS